MQYERKGQPRYLAAVVALSDDRVQRPVRRSPFRDRAIEQKEGTKSRRDGQGANQQIGRADRGEIRHRERTFVRRKGRLDFHYSIISGRIEQGVAHASAPEMRLSSICRSFEFRS